MTEGCPRWILGNNRRPRVRGSLSRSATVWPRAGVSCCRAFLRHSSSKRTHFWPSACSLSAVANCCSSFSVDWSCNRQCFSCNLAISLSTASSSSIDIGCGCIEDVVVAEVVEVVVVVAVVPSTHQSCVLVFSNTSPPKGPRERSSWWKVEGLVVAQHSEPVVVERVGAV